MAIPEALVEQFRVVALQRLERVEAAWASVLSSVDDHAAVLIHREIHTLKGESRMLGFSDVNLVCHKLEDLLEVARARGYAVDEDFDLAVNMAFRFIAMLVRKKVGSQLRGIDLPGFIKQIEAILADIKPELEGDAPGRSRLASGSMPVIKREVVPRLSIAARAHLAPVAVDTFVEYAAARGTRRDRLRVSWHAMRELIGNQRAVIGAGQLAKHKSGAIALARELGKQLDVMFDVGTAEVTSDMLDAIDGAVLHLVRNAVDHGIESPDERVAAGKPAAGRVRVRCGMIDDWLELTIEDDGRGVSLSAVRERAVQLGLAMPGDDIADHWFDLVCRPGFTTRAEPSDISGRGVGLDAVRAGITEVGGNLTARTADGAGTTWTIRLPLPRLTLVGHVFRVAFAPFPLVLDASWRLCEAVPGAHVLDIALALGLVEDSVGGPSHHLTNGAQTIAILSDRAAVTVQARRLVTVPYPSPYEIITIDTVEGLLVHPDRLAR